MDTASGPLRGRCIHAALVGAVERCIHPITMIGHVTSGRWGSSGECVSPEWAGAIVPPATHGTTLHSNGHGQKERHGNIATERVSPRATRLGARGTFGTLAQTPGGGPAARSTPAGKPNRDESVL